MITTEQIKALRDSTGISVMQCKKALEETGGDMAKAQILLRKQGADAAEKKAGRTLLSGVIASYIHGNGAVGALVELSCETDFVAQNEEFRELAHQLAMQVAASAPQFVRREEVTDGAMRAAREVFAKETEGAPQETGPTKSTKKEDVIATNRQSLNWGNEEMKKLREHLGGLLNWLERDWRKKRADVLVGFGDEGIGRNVALGVVEFEIDLDDASALGLEACLQDVLVPPVVLTSVNHCPQARIVVHGHGVDAACETVADDELRHLSDERTTVGRDQTIEVIIGTTLLADGIDQIGHKTCHEPCAADDCGLTLLRHCETLLVPFAGHSMLIPHL